MLLKSQAYESLLPSGGSPRGVLGEREVQRLRYVAV